MKRFIYLFLLAICLILVLAGCNRPSQSSETNLQTPPDSMTFEVTVPANTPEGDTVWIYVAQTPYKMAWKNGNVYTVTLSGDQLFTGGYEQGINDKIQYRYSRNGYGFRTAEYLAPTTEEPDRDTSEYFWTEHGREIVYEPGKIQQDEIARWRWFPEEGIPVRMTDIEPDGVFLPRINGVAFRSGQTIEDLYDPSFRDFFSSTAIHMKEQGYTWAEIDPPWQWTEENGLPKIVNDFTNNPNYPDDEIFLEEVMAYKKGGLRVLIVPQVCCTPLDTADRPDEWWITYFDEIERFLVHFAELAEQADADAFAYAVSSWDESLSPDIDFGYEWRNIFRRIKDVFNGEIGEMVWILGPEISAVPKPIPDALSVTWGDELDFFMVATEFPLSDRDNPSDEELEMGARAVVDGVKEFFNTYEKPVIIRNGYFNVRYSWKGQSFYQIDSVPWLSAPELELEESIYEFDTADHARTINAYFKAIAEEPWIIGYFHFGYTHWEDPLSPWMSIRGKPSEDLWRKWNQLIYDGG